MTIELWSLGKSDKKELSEGIAMYAKRLQHYTKFKLETIDNSKINKNLPKSQILEKETALVLSKLEDKDLLITLDERGKVFTSTQFADQLNTWMNMSSSKIVFVIGGSYGIGETLHQRAVQKMTLSALTFPHKLVRLIFTEQLYRAFTILKNEKYHHE